MTKDLSGLVNDAGAFNKEAFDSLPSIDVKKYSAATEGLEKYFSNGIFYEAPSKNPISWLAQKVAGPIGRSTREKKAKYFFEEGNQKEINEFTETLDKDSNLSLDYLGHYLKAHKSFVTDELKPLREDLNSLEAKYKENLSNLEKMYGFKEKGYFLNKAKSWFKNETFEEKKKRDIFEAKRKLVNESYSIEKNKLNQIIRSVGGSDRDSFEKEYSKMINFFIKTEGTLADTEVWDHRYKQTLGGSEELKKIKSKKVFS
jgi:hypothetical protein